MKAPPSRLYKYQPFTAQSLVNLKSRTLWFSSPAHFNDPYDCALRIVDLNLPNSDLQRAWRSLFSGKKLSASVEAELLSNGSPNEKFRSMLIESAGQLFESERNRAFYERGVASLSAKNDDLLLWSYYADGHRGFCLEFDTSDEPFSGSKKVVYRPNIPSFNPIDLLTHDDKTDELFEMMVLTKYYGLRHEEEWRVLHKEANKAYTYDSRLLTGVYLGAAMPPDHKDMMGQLLFGSPTQLYELMRDDKAFRVTAQRVTYTPYAYDKGWRGR